MGIFSLPKSERICSLKDIEDVFKKGSSFFEYPFRVVYKVIPSPIPSVQVMFSVPRKRFKLAVDRNLLRRRMKEAYRQTKPLINLNCNKLIRVCFIYSSNSTIQYTDIQKSIEKILVKVHDRLKSIE